MNELTQQLNEQIQSASPDAFAMLSDLGRRIYFPSKGILSQSAEAKQKAKRFNATIGTAFEDGHAMYLDGIMDNLSGISPNNALLYAPSSGKPELRKCWLEKNLHDNPSMRGIGTSLPVVTNGLSHGLSLAADMFLDAGDAVLMPNMNWDNYQLNFHDRIGAIIHNFNLFSGDGIDIGDFCQALSKFKAGQKVLVVMNFPNNPSGYTPTEKEGCQLAQALLAAADAGLRLVVLVDDAYFSLFYGEEVMRESFFCKIAGKHPNLLAIKADAATKEAYVWGLRVGFITYAVYGQPSGSPLYAALEAKTAGLIRSTVSNCSALSQYLVHQALSREDFYEKRSEKADIMKARAMEVKRVLAAKDYSEVFTAYPFNSGYFMCIRLKEPKADELRKKLLDDFGIGTICMGPTDLRIAFSCLEKDNVEELFDTIFKAGKEMA